jgi:hypothetical protein
MTARLALLAIWVSCAGMSLRAAPLNIVLIVRASPRSEMFWQRRGDKAARVGHWKWVESDHGGGLYDLSQDVGEQNDLSQSPPAKLAELAGRFARLAGGNGCRRAAGAVSRLLRPPCGSGRRIHRAPRINPRPAAVR